jgi:hypothetical protein
MPMSRIALIAALVALPLAACSGSAEAATQNYGISNFSKMRIAGPFDVHVHVGGSPSAHASGPKDALDRLSVEQNGDTLVVKALPGGWGGWPTGSRGPVVVEVSVPDLRSVSVTGSGDVTVDRMRGDAVDLALSGSGSLDIGAIDAGAVSAVMTGSGDMSLAGKTRTATAVLTGSGDLKAGSLVADDAQTKLVGSGDLALGARHFVKVVLAGSGDVTISGPAACSVTRSGSGDVQCAKGGSQD